MNGDSTENLTNGSDDHQIIDDTPSPGIKANSNNPFATMIDLGLSDKPFQGDSPANRGGNNPFSSPGAQAFGGFGEVVNPFTDMSGSDANALVGFEDGRGNHSSSEGGDDSLDGSCNDQLLNLSGEEFKRASPTMFEESQSPSMFEKPPVEPIESSNDGQDLMNHDFVPNATHAWISSPNSNASTEDNSSNMSTMAAAAAGVGANPLTNPFLPPNKCGDSGFISPAGNSQHQSASSSSEDSAENREERESVERASSVGSDRQSDVASVHETTEIEKRESISSDKEGEGNVNIQAMKVEEEDSDEEEKEHQEVHKLLSGGMIDPQFGELMANASRETPTPPVEENGSTLEEILAAARNQPDEPGLVEDVDSDETSSDADDELVEDPQSSVRKSSQKSLPIEVNENIEQSAGIVECDEIDSSNDESSDADDDGFTFVKKDEDCIIKKLSQSASPLILDTVVNVGEQNTQEVDIELSQNFEKPEVILKSALVNPNEEDNFSNLSEENQGIGESVNSAINIEESTNENTLEDINQNIDKIQETTEKIEDKISGSLLEEVPKNLEIIGDSDLQTIEERIDEHEVNQIPLFNDQNTLIQTSQTQDILPTGEIAFVPSVAPLEVSPADNTLNALEEDYINQDLAEAESSSAPSSLESQSGPASVIIESQEVPIPDQASFILKPTQSHHLDLLPSPQEAIVEVIPEEHFREQSQSPILEENEEMSDSEDKSPTSTTHLKNGDDFTASGCSEDNTITKQEIKAHLQTETDVEADTAINEDLELNQNGVDAEIIAEKMDSEKAVESASESAMVVNATTNNDIPEPKLDETQDAVTTEHVINDDVCDDTNKFETNGNGEHKVSLIDDAHLETSDSKETQDVLSTENLVPSEQDTPMKDLLIDASSTLLDTIRDTPSESAATNEEFIEGSLISVDVKEEKLIIETECNQPDEHPIVEVAVVVCAGDMNQPPSGAIEEPINEQLKGDETNLTPLLKGLTIACDESRQENNIPEDDVQEPPTAQVTEGNVGFYSETNFAMESEGAGPKETLADCEENIPKILTHVEESIDESNDTGKAQNVEVDESVVLDAAVPEPTIQVESHDDNIINQSSLETQQKEISLGITPQVNITPSSPLPQTKDDVADVPMNKEDIVHTTTVGATEVKEIKKVDAKKPSQQKPTASPTRKPISKPGAAKLGGLSGNKSATLTAKAPVAKSKPAATKPSTVSGSRLGSSTANTKPQSSASSSLAASKRPISGSSSTPRVSSANTNVKANPGTIAKTAARSPITRTAPSTTTRAPATAKAPLSKPKTTATSNTAGIKPPTTTRTAGFKQPVTKTKIDETKKTVASTLSARSTVTRTASPAGSSRSRTPSSPKTTVSKPTRTTTNTTVTSTRSAVTSTTASRASTKPTTTTTSVGAARKAAPTQRTAPVKTNTSTIASRTTATRTVTPSNKTASNMNSPSKTRPGVTDIARRPLVPSGPRPTDLTKKRIPSAKDKQQPQTSTKSNLKKKDVAADSLPDGNGAEKVQSNNSEVKLNGGSSPEEVTQLPNGASNGDDGNLGSGQIPGTPVESSGAASPVTGEPALQNLANGGL